MSAATRAPVDTIYAPQFPPRMAWLNAGAPARRVPRDAPMLLEFWDFCRPNSLRTLPYMKTWHERYAGAGLRVIGAHAPGFEPSHRLDAVAAAVTRLQVPYPVAIDSDFELWREYGNEGWPARYLFDRQARLFEYHHGEGAYLETELAIQELLGIERDPIAPLRAEDDPAALLAAQSEDRPGAYDGPYEAGGVWLVLDGRGTVSGRGGDGARAQLTIASPGAYALIEHPRHTAGVLQLELDAGLRCLATCFTPGRAP